MILIEGEFNNAQVFAEGIDEATETQILRMMSHPAFEGGQVSIMPDCHAGSGSCIGFTYPISDRVCPNTVGVDIGCGMTVAPFRVDLRRWVKELDAIARFQLPSGRHHHDPNDPSFSRFRLQFEKTDLYAEVLAVSAAIGYGKDAVLQLGTLGGGNHFIEAGAEDGDEELSYLTVHSGSRNFGLSICNFYQKLAVQHVQKHRPEFAQMKDLAYLEAGTPEFDAYLWAMDVAQRFAEVNRRRLIEQIRSFLPVLTWAEPLPLIESIHNYIDPGSHILRKGAISAEVGEQVVIPFNMRDGLILGRGKGNPSWNNSAPHGAGRLVARGVARRTLSMKKFEDDMKAVYSTSVTPDTLDESPSAYKDTNSIVAALVDTVDIGKWVRPFYNFKAND